MRYKIQVFGWTLIWSSLFLFGFIGYQLWVTDWLNAGVQAEAAAGLSASFDSSSSERTEVQVVPPSDEGESSRPSGDGDGVLPADNGVLPRPAENSGGAGSTGESSAASPETVEYFLPAEVSRGEPFAFLTVPKARLEDVVVYEGTDRTTLKSGPGHISDTPLPGQPGNSVLSGHRTTYGRPFFDFDLLEPGDAVEVETAAGLHVYEVREIIVVDPTDVWVTDPREGGWLTLTTCEPKFSARKRLVVFAEMVSGPNFSYIEAT